MDYYERVEKRTSKPVDHSGHRKRLKKRFAEEGLRSFEEHNILELLLFYTIPRIDTNETAHRLIDTFGSFAGVLEASPRALSSVVGIGQETALFLSLLMSVFWRYSESFSDAQYPIESPPVAAALVQNRYSGRSEELLYLLCFDANCVIQQDILIAEGGHASVEVNIRKIVTEALKVEAAGVIVVHNHPSGLVLPSGEDLRTTRRLSQALHSVGIALLDHFLVSENTHTALSDNKLFKPLFSVSYRAGCAQYRYNERR